MPPPNRQRRIKKSSSAPALTPEQQRKRAMLFQKLHEAIGQGYASQALVKLLELQKQFPDDINVCMLLGQAYSALGGHKDAIASFKKAVKLAPKQPEIILQYGIALQQANELEQALTQFDRVLSHKPDHFYALRYKSAVLNDLGREDEGYAVWQKLDEAYRDVNLDPERANALAISGAHYAPKRIDAQECVDRLEVHIAESKERHFRRAGYFQLGRLYTHLSQYDKAFDAYTESKMVDRDEWDPDEHSRRIDQLIECWKTDQPIPFSDAKGVDGSRLVFIVGMMRSGTSLTEQMLAQCKDITPGGEMSAIDRTMPKSERMTMKHGQRLPLNRALYTKSTLNTMASSAMKVYNAVDPLRTVTDKQPYHYLFLPLIAHLFPGAKIIHCVRDPLDCCLSNFTMAFWRVHMQTHDPYWLGRYYADYERVMDAWREVPEVDMIDLRYEDLVSDPETQSKRVMEFLGHAWSEEILDFYKSERTVHTASRAQVRRPIYTSSVQKYLPFEHRMGEIKRGIEEGRARSHPA
jgi:cytochrome c-type biogenesis protein CcmH/NrfG